MSRPRTYKTEAIVLKQMPFGEADRVLTLYSPEMGKVHAVAKGVRRTRSKLGGHLELLNRVSISLAQGRNLDVVSEVEVIQTFRAVREDLQRLSRALYMAELVDSFSTEGASNDEVYQLLLDGLAWLEESRQQDLLLRYFELRLLDYCGYRPELFYCVECRSTLEPGDHLFSCAVGGVLCPACRAASNDPMTPAPLNAMKLLRFLQREQYARAESMRVPPASVSEAERLLQAYLRFLMEKELKSAEFMNLVASTIPG